jgi:hypothetical protein
MSAPVVDSQQDVSAWARAYEEGCSLRKIAATFCVSSATAVHRELVRVGVKMRPAGQRRTNDGMDRAKRWRLRHPEQMASIVFKRNLRKKYNLSLEDYEAMLLRQGGRCAICRDLPTDQKLAVDHCHATGKVRGLLCSVCNLSLGGFRDNIRSLQEAIKYLRRANGE